MWQLLWYWRIANTRHGFWRQRDRFGGICGLPTDLDPPDDPELFRDAKGWLSAKMNAPYNETDHQPRMTALFAFQEAMAVSSFARMVKKLRSFFQSTVEENPRES